MNFLQKSSNLWVLRIWRKQRKQKMSSSSPATNGKGAIKFEKYQDEIFWFKLEEGKQVESFVTSSTEQGLRDS